MTLVMVNYEKWFEKVRKHHVIVLFCLHRIGYKQYTFVWNVVFIQKKIIEYEKWNKLFWPL